MRKGSNKKSTVFFERLRRACFERDMSVSALLKELGYSTSSGTYWGNGTIPSLDKIIRIAEYFNIPVNEFISHERSGLPDGSYQIAKPVNESGRASESRVTVYNPSGDERPSVSDREVGRLEGRIEELEKKNAEYREIIENLNDRLGIGKTDRQTGE